MKKVLVITYYWPPKGTAGVFRWLQLSKYLPEFDWKPVIYTPENGEVPHYDESLLEDVSPKVEVIKSKIWEPFGIYKKLFGKKEVGAVQLQKSKSSNDNGLELAKWIRGNLFIPDSRMFWIRPSVKRLKKYLKENQIDAIISTGPPHSCHMIAYKLKKEFNIRWIADFRDPWTNIDFSEDLKVSNWAFKRQRKLETGVLKSADEVIVVSKDMEKEFLEIHPRSYQFITNGYDPDHYKDVSSPDKSSFLITYIGSVNSARNPIVLWKALGEMVKSNISFAEKLRIKFVGQIDFSVRESVAENKLENYFEYIPPVGHKEALEIAGQTTLLLLLINNAPNVKGILTGKMFEYFGIGRKILCVGPTDGDAAKIISDIEAGVTLDFEDFSGMKEALDKLFTEYQTGEIYNIDSDASKFSRRTQAKEFSELLNKFID